MSLTFQFNLTPAQGRLLMACAFGHYRRDGDNKAAPLMPDYHSPFFLATAKCLQAKGLMTHDPAREPTFLATPAGVSIANLIAAEARRMVELAETAKPLPNSAARSKVKSGR